MPRDRSLDEFLTPGGVPDGETKEADHEPEPATAPAESGDTEQVVDPIAATYGWSPDGGECAACSDTVDERWRDDGEFVCGDCKEW